MKQIVEVLVLSEDGCNILNDEYSVSLVGVVGGLNLTEHGGESDIDLIKTAVTDWISGHESLMNDNVDEDTSLLLQMSSKEEHEEGYTNKWFEVDSWSAEL